MVDRQDIDALLISALYGELTPADEARLQTHLESHPTDKTTLADLTFARNAVRDSRILTVQLEPPQAVSALLLQEAARRSAKPAIAKSEPGEGWFHRFVRSFAAHPAMAAVAMLVVVVGVAGTLYMRGGSRYVEPRAVSEQSPPAETAAVESKRTNHAGSAFEATLNETKLDKFEGVVAKHDQPAKKATNTKRSPTYIAGDGDPALRPQDIDELQFKPAKTESARDGEEPRTKSTGSKPAPDANATPGVVNPQPPPPVAPSPVAQATANGRSNPDDAKDKNDSGNGDDAWAKETHTKVVAAVRAKNCRDATALAVSLSNRAPGYYTNHVENDRALKECATYINAEREKELERVQRARATQQRRNAEPAQSKPPAAGADTRR